MAVRILAACPLLSDGCRLPRFVLLGVGRRATPLYDPVEIRLTSTRAFDNPYRGRSRHRPAWPDPMDPRRRPSLSDERELDCPPSARQTRRVANHDPIGARLRGVRHRRRLKLHPRPPGPLGLRADGTGSSMPMGHRSCMQATLLPAARAHPRSSFFVSGAACREGLR